MCKCVAKRKKKITNSHSLTSLSVFISLYSGNWTLIIYNISSRKHFENTLLILPARCELIHESNVWKESLKHDGPQFHQFQQNKQSPLILTHWTHKKKDHNVWLWKSRSLNCLGQAQKYGRVFFPRKLIS